MTEAGTRPTRAGGRPLLAVVAAVVLSVAVAIIDAARTSRAVAPVGLVASVPLLIAAVSGVTGTLVAGSVAVGVLLLMADYDHALWDRDVVILVVGVTITTAFAVVTASARGRRTWRLRRVESVTDVVQQTLLRPLPHRVNDVAIATHYASATRAAQVGGDVYDVQDTAHGLRLFVGDVRGKGLPALHLANTALGAFREWSHESPTLTELASRLDASVARAAGAEDFVTGLVVEVRPDALEIVNCGHPVPLLLTEVGLHAVEPPASSLPLGLGVTAQPHRVPFTPGDRFLLYTDGVSEARRRGRFFDVARELAQACDDRSIDDAVHRLHRRLVKFARRRLDDDIAIVLLERAPAAIPDQPDPLDLFEPYFGAATEALDATSGR